VALWEWKYGTQSNGTGFTITDDVGDLQAFSGYWPKKIVTGSDEISGMNAIDLMVRPKARGRIYHNLAEISKELSRSTFVYGFANDLSVQYHRKLFSESTRIQFLERPVRKMISFLDPLKAAGKLSRVMAPARYTYRIAMGRLLKAAQDGFEVVRVVEVDESFNDLWAAVKNMFSYVHRRDAEYVAWRFLDRKIAGHQVWGAYRNRRLEGYMVTAIKPSKTGRVGLLVDWLCPPNGPVFGVLLNQAMSFFWVNDVWKCECWYCAPSRRWFAALTARLFLPWKTAKTFLGFYETDLCSASKINPKEIFVTMGDSDHPNPDRVCYA